MAFKHLTCDELAKWITADKDAINIIDIRDPTSFSQGHIQEAVYIDNANVEHYINQADKDKPLVVCCYHGNSSQGAANYFSEHGFKDTYSLDGGFEEWRHKQFHDS